MAQLLSVTAQGLQVLWLEAGPVLRAVYIISLLGESALYHATSAMPWRIVLGGDPPPLISVAKLSMFIVRGVGRVVATFPNKTFKLMEEIEVAPKVLFCVQLSEPLAVPGFRRTRA